MTALAGVRVVTTALNVPGPVAAAHLRDLGASVVKVEPPVGDPLLAIAPGWYAALAAGMDVRTIDLKQEAGRTVLDGVLAGADVLLTAQRPAALERLGLGQPALGARHPRLVHVALVGHAAPDQGRPGHDLTYLAETGLIDPAGLPRTLAADLLGAERMVGTSLLLLLGRERGEAARYAEVALADGAGDLAAPLRHGLTAPGGPLCGGLPGYGIYAAGDGHVAIAALEASFAERLRESLGLAELTHTALAAAFAARSAAEWQAWAAERDLPLVAVAGPRVAARPV